MSCFDLGGWLICQSLRLTVFLWSSVSFAFEHIINQRTYTSIMGQAAESLNLPLSGSFHARPMKKFLKYQICIFSRRRNHRIVCAFGENLEGFSQKP